MPEMPLNSSSREMAGALPATSLSAGAELFVWSVREWLAAARERRCVKRNLIPRYHAVECVDAILPLDEMMCLLAVSALRPIQIRHCGCSALSDDEMRLVQCLRAVQRGDDELAGQHLASLLPGPFSRTFLRPARQYASAICSADLRFTGARHLMVVEGADR